MNDTTNCVKDGGEDERKRLRHDFRSDNVKGNQQAVFKLSLSMYSVSSFNTLLIHCYYFTHTWIILRPYSKVSKGTGEVGIKRGYSRDIVLFVQQLRRMLGFLKEYFSGAMDSLCHYVGNNSRISRLGLLTIFCVLFSFASVVEAQVQELRQGGATGQMELVPLIVGQKVPEEFWTKEHLFYVNGDTLKQNLAAYRDKVLLLGFWSTWCGACMKNGLMIENFVKQYSDKIAYVKINSVQSEDNIEKIEKFLDNPLGRRYKLDKKRFSSIVEDVYFQQIFPHFGYPFYIWINKGIVQIATFRNLLDEHVTAQLWGGVK